MESKAEGVLSEYEYYLMKTDAAKALEVWFREQGGYLHPDVVVSYSSEQGIHWRAKAAINTATTVSIVPHSVALSYLNALVDDAYPVFKQQRREFGGIENIGFFYLMTQYIHKDSSLWRPYLESLPQPTSSFNSPLWLESSDDLAWLEETDVLHTMLGRRAAYEQYHRSGVTTLKQAGIDTELYTWGLFRWAVTMFTSRAFSSRAIAPQDSKYWTTYKTGYQGRRQTVLIDMSNTPAEDLDFSVLFPMQDVPNHSHDAHVDWTFDPGRFSVTINDPVEAGEEIFNNYGPKGNGELLLGYGFCLLGNPHDSVMLTLKPPPEDLQAQLKRVHPGYFKRGDGRWDSERASFHIRRPTSATDGRPEQILNELPVDLLELLTCILRHERGLPFAFFEQPLQYLTSTNGSRYLPHVARMIVQSLAPKLAKLDAVQLPPHPQNEKQRQASIYRTGHTEILSAVMACLRRFTRSLLRSVADAGSRVVTLEGFMELWFYRSTSFEKSVPAFLQGIEANAGTLDVTQLRMAGWEEDVFVLALCTAVLEGEDWVREALPEYVLEEDLRQDIADSRMGDVGELVEHARDLLGIVQTAAEAIPDSAIWTDGRWTAALIATMGKVLLYDSMTMMVPDIVSGRDEARMVVYLHSASE